MVNTTDWGDVFCSNLRKQKFICHGYWWLSSANKQKKEGEKEHLSEFIFILLRPSFVFASAAEAATAKFLTHTVRRFVGDKSVEKEEEIK